MPYEYDDEGGTHYYPDPKEDGHRQETECLHCDFPGTALGVWHNDETTFAWDTFRHTDSRLDEACEFTKKLSQGARL